jgi:hypothetical protein
VFVSLVSVFQQFFGVDDCDLCLNSMSTHRQFVSMS